MIDEPSAAVTPQSRRLAIKWQVWALLAILLLAAFLRLWKLDTLPPGLYHDEAYNGLDALSLINRETFPIFYEGWELYASEAHENRPVQESLNPVFFEGNFGREPVHIYLMALSILVLGPSSLAVRIVPALAGVLAVFTTYLAAKALLGIQYDSKKAGSEEESRSRLIWERIKTTSKVINPFAGSLHDGHSLSHSNL
jgi:4-amino-4-deoxy-L-arabinose transferase-like glycosyltransferase